MYGAIVQGILVEMEDSMNIWDEILLENSADARQVLECEECACGVILVDHYDAKYRCLPCGVASARPNR